PAVNSTYPIGYFREDYEYVAHPSDPSYLDVHNGRFCITPEYPLGIYCYFATVDANHNSAYPYVVGPTFYGNKTSVKVTTISESTTQYTLANADFNLSKLNIKVYPNPAQEFIAIQSDMIADNLDVALIDELGKVVQTNKILQGSTLSIIDLSTVYNGIYFIKVASAKESKTFKIVIDK
ncbi:MAG: T9SS type A sorting domain-containing protein, partial [Bacteroidota bacterium]